MNVFDRRATVGMSVLCALLATAGQAETRSTPAKGDPLVQRVCDALHTLPATRKAQCCGTTPGSLAALCGQELGASLARKAVALDAAAIEQCAAASSRQLEGCGWVTPLMPRLPDACRNLVHGQIRAGAACRSSLECADGLFCRGMGPGKQGVCAAPGAARARCETPSDRLASFTRAEDADARHPVCDGLCIKGRCLPFSPAGGACRSSAQCTPDLNCISGRCQDRPLPKVGESCAGDTSCGAGAYCQAGVCAALKNAGEPCALLTECRALSCVMAPGAKVGRCGEPCGASSPSARKPGPPAP